MHPVNVHKYGNSFLMNALEGITSEQAERAGVCGVWSAKDIIGHLGAMELFLVEALEEILGIEGPRPQMQMMMQNGPAATNDIEAEKRASHSLEQVLEEYQGAYTRVMELLPKIPKEQYRLSGLLKWYGDEYDLEDFLIYSFYAHKREHGAQLNILKDRLQDGSL